MDEQEVFRGLLKKEYRLIACVDLETGRYRLFNVSEGRILAPDEGDYSKMMEDIAPFIVEPEKRGEFIENTALSYICRRLETGEGEYDYFYYCIAADTPYWAELHASYADPEKRQVLLTSRDIQNFVDKSRLSDKIKEMRGEEERFDEMTGLLKYNYFQEESLKLMGRPGAGQRFGVVYADIGNFKYINLLYGYQEGNRILKDFAVFLESGIHEGFSSRIISDFYVKLFKIEERECFSERIKQMEERLLEFVARRQREYPESGITIACGCCEVRGGGRGLAEAIDNANTARKIVKQSGKSGCLLYDRRLGEELEREKALSAALKKAFREDQFLFYLQPKVNLQTGKIVGAEALARWSRDDGSVALPAEFIPAMEKDGSIVELDFLICEKVCRYLAECIRREEPVVTVSLNVSSEHFKSGGFVERLNGLVERYGISPSLLEFELTERDMIDMAGKAATVFSELKRHGYRTAIDDFGSEYSSLSLITELDVDVLKIDRSLLGYEDSVSPRKRAVISSVAEMADKLHMTILAEGAETMIQAEIVKEEGCTLAQGFCFARPIRMENFQKYLRDTGGYVLLPWREEQKKSVWNVAEEYKEPSELSASSVTIITNSMFNILPGGVAGFDVKTGELLFVSDGMFEITGYKRSELLDYGGRVSYGGLFDPGKAEENHRQILRQLKKADRAFFEYPIVKRDGSEGWVKLYAGYAGSPEWGQYLLCTVFDDTVSHKNQTELQSTLEKIVEQKNFYNKLYTSIPCGIVQVSMDLEYVRLLNANPAAAHIFGYENEKEFRRAVDGKARQEVVYEQDRAKVAAAFGTLQKVGDKIQVEYRILTRSGRPRWISGVRECLLDISDRQVFQETFMDATERKLLEESRQKEKNANSELKIAREASRAKSRFLSNMSHDIRTPMNAIMGMARIARAHSGDPDKVRECLDKIDISSRYLLNLINDVLDMSKIESGKVVLSPEPFSMKGYLEGIRELMRHQAEEKGQTLTVEAGSLSHDRVVADRLHLQQVLINILSNAVKFTQEGGNIRCVVTETRKVPGKKARYRIVISDNGRGMSREFQSRLFQSFTREQDSIGNHIEGTGLGMSIAKGLVDLMGGTISVESERQKGSAFTLEFVFPYEEDSGGMLCGATCAAPCGGACDGVQGEACGEGRGEKAGRPLEKSFDFSGRRVLVVEDNGMNQDIFKELLEMYGARVEVVDNGRDAVRRFEEREPGYYQVIFMDVQMPVMDGYEATRAIRNSGRPDASTVPIVAMTANTFSDDVQKGKKAGMDAHIPKPLDVEVLSRTMRQIFGSGTAHVGAGEGENAWERE